MARIIVLDSGPLGDASRKRGNRDVGRLREWWITAKANGSIIAVPEMADYEVRRGLLLAGARDGIHGGARLLHPDFHSRDAQGRGALG